MTIMGSSPMGLVVLENPLFRAHCHCLANLGECDEHCLVPTGPRYHSATVGEGRVDLAAVPRHALLLVALMLRPIPPSFLPNHLSSPHTLISDHAYAPNYRSFSRLRIICTAPLATPKDCSQCRVSVPSAT